MKISEMCDLLEATVVYGNDGLLEKQVHTAFAGDLMSDVLAYSNEEQVLITGLANPQVIRTAEMMDMCCVVLIRGKRAGLEMIRLAEASDIVLLESNLTMYESCGRLYHIDLIMEEQANH